MRIFIRLICLPLLLVSMCCISSRADLFYYLFGSKEPLENASKIEKLEYDGLHQITVFFRSKGRNYISKIPFFF